MIPEFLIVSRAFVVLQAFRIKLFEPFPDSISHVAMIRATRQLLVQGLVPRLAVSMSTKAEADMKPLYLDAQATTPMDPRYRVG